MTHVPAMSAQLLRRRCLQSACVAAFAGSLAACATPTYPTDARGTAAAAARATPAPAMTPTPAPTPAPAPPTVQETTIPAPAPAPVESQPLPPPSTEAVAPQAYAQPPAYSPPAYAPPAPREVTRTVAGGEVVKATRMYRDYVVRKGDHLDAIARDFDVSADELGDANHLKSPDALRPGQHLKIPVAKAYVVQSGDTLATVAKRFDLTAQDLAELNDLGVRDRLRSGDRLALPADFHDRGPTKVTETVYAKQDRYRAPRPRDDQPLPTSGVYTPSAAALEAARERASSGAVASTPSTQPYRSYADTNRYAPVVGRPVGEAAPVLTDAQISAAGRGRFVWPVRGETLAKFGAEGVGRRNDGLDLRSPQGTVVRAAAAGEVVYAGNQVPGFGNLVLVKHADGWVTAYAHLDHASVAMRQTVMQGQEIGQVGASGGAAEPELHFEVRYAAAPTDKAKPIDPMLVLPE